MHSQPEIKRSIGLGGAVGVGVGAIVGGGILALAGVAFATTGPAALVAFALNGLVALITALSFAEMSAAFPQSGGTYFFAKKVLSVRAAFLVGWVVWFASIVASVLYALGFAFFAVELLQSLFALSGRQDVTWLGSRFVVVLLAMTATLVYTFSLLRRPGGGSQWINIGKVFFFVVLIVAGVIVLFAKPFSFIESRLTPFFSGGALGLFQAMGYTFIALQGFDLIAAVAGEIREPQRNIPRAMLMSLGIALMIYLPLLFIVAVVGVPAGQSITALSTNHPETIIAVAAETYLGPFGYWLVIAAALLAMLSALQANLFAASRVAMKMAQDRTLTHVLDGISPKHGTPQSAILATALLVITILLILPNVAAAGAASSLIFLITFAMNHRITYLARRRGGKGYMPFKVPWFPLVPVTGILACVSLALFQGIAVPSAGLIALVWLGFGGFLYFSLFSQRARVVDAAAEASDPQLVQLRGKSPLVLVPIANPGNAAAMIDVANAMSHPNIGRVLLLNVISGTQVTQRDKIPQKLKNLQHVLKNSFSTSLSIGLAPEALTTIAPSPWNEIIRVSRLHRCESILLGFSNLSEDLVGSALEEMLARVESDVVVLRAPKGWRLSNIKRILVPVAGRNVHDQLRARLLTSISRAHKAKVTFLKVFSKSTAMQVCKKGRHDLNRFAREEVGSDFEVKIARNNQIADEIIRQSSDQDLIVLGLQRFSRRRRVFGEITLKIAGHSNCGIIMINHKR